MSTLKKNIGLLQEMPEHQLEAVYMRFVNSQTDDIEVIPSANKDVKSMFGIAHEYANPTLIEKETAAFENVAVEKFFEKREKGFQGLMSFTGTLPEGFDYERELQDARKAKYAHFI